MTEEAQGAEPVVDGHDHGVAVAHQVAAPVEEDRPAARREATPVDEDHHRPALARAPTSVTSGSSGVQTLSERQSSLCGSDAAGSDGLVMPGTAADCGAIGPKVDASRTSSQALGLQRGAPAQRADRRPAVGDPRERPQVLTPDAPESPLSDRHDTLHVRGPYGDKRRRSIESRSNRYTNGGEQHANSGLQPDGNRGDAEIATMQPLRCCAVDAVNCRNTVRRRAPLVRVDHGRRALLGALLSTAAATNAGATTSTTLPGPAPNQSQINATQSQVSQIESDAGPGGAADLHPRRQVQHGPAEPPERADGAADDRRQPRPRALGGRRRPAARRERRRRGLRLRHTRDRVRLLLLLVGDA